MAKLKPMWLPKVKDALIAATEGRLDGPTDLAWRQAVIDAVFPVVLEEITPPIEATADAMIEEVNATIEDEQREVTVRAATSGAVETLRPRIEAAINAAIDELLAKAAAKH